MRRLLPVALAAPAVVGTSWHTASAFPRDARSGRRCIHQTASAPASTPGKVKVRVTTITGEKKEFSAPSGITLMEAIRDVAKIDMEAACDGTCACSTCHVIFTQESYDRLPDTPCEDEMDMLDLAPKVSSTSRLSCQVKLTESLDTIELTIPDEMENQMSY